jgi:hypothetical protein
MSYLENETSEYLNQAIKQAGKRLESIDREEGELNQQLAALARRREHVLEDIADMERECKRRDESTPFADCVQCGESGPVCCDDGIYPDGVRKDPTCVNCCASSHGSTRGNSGSFERMDC